MEVSYAMASGTVPTVRRPITNINPYLFFPSKPIFFPNQHSTSISSSRFASLRSVCIHAGAGHRSNHVISEQKLTHQGLITESLSNGMFRVRLDNEDVIIGYISGRIRRNMVRIIPGDRVEIELSRYDSTKGRIIYRIPIKKKEEDSTKKKEKIKKKGSNAK